MNQYQRLKFYIACFFKDLKWKLCADKQIEEFEQSLVPEESVSGAEVKLIEDIIFMDEEEQKEQKPALEPRRTMLFISGRRRRCNFLNAWWYRRAILRNYHWGKQRGFTEYVADPYSPFGLLAMETLGRLKRSGEKLLLYSVHSCHVGQRRSYRLIPETGLEVLFLENAVPNGNTYRMIEHPIVPFFICHQFRIMTGTDEFLAFLNQDLMMII